MTRWRWVLLLFELFVFALILVLPQVDLPDTAFREGNSPVMAKLQVNAAPVMSVGQTGVQTWFLHYQRRAMQRDIPPSEGMTIVGRPSLLCTLLC